VRRLRNAVETLEVEWRLLQIQLVSVVFRWYARLTSMLGFASWARKWPRISSAGHIGPSKEMTDIGAKDAKTIPHCL